MRALDRRLSGRYRVVTMFVNVPYAVACIAREQPSAAVWSMPVCRVLRFFSINYLRKKKRGSTCSADSLYYISSLHLQLHRLGLDPAVSVEP